MANMLAMGLDPVQNAIRQRINTGAVLPTEPVVPTDGQAAAVPSPAFAQPAATPQMPSDVTSAIRARIAPQPGQTRTFPNGRVGRYDGNGWLHVG